MFLSACRVLSDVFLCDLCVLVPFFVLWYAWRVPPSLFLAMHVSVMAVLLGDHVPVRCSLSVLSDGLYLCFNSTIYSHFLISPCIYQLVYLGSHSLR